MNGEIDSTMDESLKSSHSSSPENIPEINKDTNIDENKDLESSVKPDYEDNTTNVEDNGITENINNTNPELSQEPKESSETNQLDNVESKTKFNEDSAEKEQQTSSIISDENNSKDKDLTTSSTVSADLGSPEILDNTEEKDDNLNDEYSKTDSLKEVCNGSELTASENEHEHKGTHTVNIDSESDGDAKEDKAQNGKIKEVNTMLANETQNGHLHDSHSSEVHEIQSDDNESPEVTAKQEKSTPTGNKSLLRRSNRTITRKRYTDEFDVGEESDIEEVVMIGPMQKKSKPIFINDTKALIEMATKQIKANQNLNYKREPTVVIIDTKSTGTDKGLSSMYNKCPVSSINCSAQSLYQNIVACGTTVTPVSVKTSTSTQCTSQNQQPIILPSLTDDMFVVEAPSFIVPYVYEKPSLKPFREFVDILGKQLEEEKAKEEKELIQKIKKDSCDKNKEEETQNKSDVQDVVGDDEDKTNSSASDQKNQKRSDKKERRKRKRDDDDASWDGESSTDSEDEVLSDEEVKTIVIKDKMDSIEEIKDVSDLTIEKVCLSKPDNYFDCTLGKFFINIGLNLVQEYVQNDLLKQQNRKLQRDKKTGQSTKNRELSISLLTKNLELSKENNAPFTFPQTKCESCSFKTESAMVMSNHLETPHMKNNLYQCNFCKFEVRNALDIVQHMDAVHDVTGKLERAPAYHQCANCPFEDNGKGKLARHLIPCSKKFKPETNLAPPLEWEPPAKIPKIPKSRNSIMSPYGRSQVGNHLGRPMLNLNSMMPAASSGYRPRNRAPVVGPTRSSPVHGIPIARGGLMVRQSTPIAMSTNIPIANSKSKSIHQPSISITPLPRQPLPVQQTQPVQQQAPNAKSTFVICEICDGYIKDLEQLRNHMQWIHKVKIHPKMIYNRPPLNCQKCQFRFFTDQGLERHLLGTHGLVTSSMQEAANKGKDAGRCPVCGRVYQWKLLSHVARDHNLTLKPAHLSYKCTVCTATFGMYKQFENHVYSAHSVVAKRVNKVERNEEKLALNI